MNTSTTSSSSLANSVLPLTGRVLVALIFLVSAFGKIAAPAGTIGYIGSVGIPLPSLAYVLALVTELGGGLMLLLGYRTRAVAAALAVFSVVSALFFHHALGDQNQMFHFLKNLAMAGGLLQFVAFGGGSYSVDNRRAEASGALSLAR